ncbi:MAG: Flp family type IVb pilin, partial [Burkholderiales bacterium]
MKPIMRFKRKEAGAAAVEYALMVALIAAVSVAVVTRLGVQVCTGFAYVSGKLVPASIFGPRYTGTCGGGGNNDDDDDDGGG